MNQENQEKRTLKSEEEEKETPKKSPRNMFPALVFTIVVVLIMSGLLGTLLAKYENVRAELQAANIQNEFLESQVKRLTEDALASEQTTTPSTATSSTPSTTVPREPEPVEQNPELTATYRYAGLADIPETLPSDTHALWFKVDQPCTKAQAGTVLAATMRETIDTRITLAVPELGEISDECAKYGYGLISVLIESVEHGRASLKVFAFNPEEEPYIEIYTDSGGWMYADMDVQVFNMSFYSRMAWPEDGLYRTSGVSERSYGYFGGGNSGSDDYAFDAFHVVQLDADDWCDPLAWALEDIPEYFNYWQENRDLVMTRRGFFSDDRSEFRLLDYLKTVQNVKLKSITDTSVTLKRSDGSELIIQKHVGDDKRGDYATFTKDGEDYRYALAYHPRVNGLPTRVYLENGIPLTSEQVKLLLKFIENPPPLF